MSLSAKLTILWLPWYTLSSLFLISRARLLRQATNFYKEPLVLFSDRGTILGWDLTRGSVDWAVAASKCAAIVPLLTLALRPYAA